MKFTLRKTKNNLKNLKIPLKTLLIVVNASPSKFRSRIIKTIEAIIIRASKTDHKSEKYV